MDRLGHQDRAGDGQVVLAGDQRSCTEVGRSTDALEDGGEAQETLGVDVGYRVGAGLDWCHTSLLQGTGEELDVILLIMCDILKVVVVVATVTCNAISIKHLNPDRIEMLTYRPSRSPQRRTPPGHPCKRRSRGAQGVRAKLRIVGSMSSRATIGAAEVIEARRGSAPRIVFFIVKKD